MAHTTERHHLGNVETKDTAVYGVIAEFDTADELVDAGREMHHGQGFRRLDALSPFPVHGIDEAIGTPRSKLGYIVAAFALFGLANGVFMIWYIGAVDYPLVIGGKPYFSWEFSVPVLFELTVLFSSFAAVIGMIVLNGLPRFYHPVFNYKRITDATNDKFLLVVEAGDPNFDIEETPRLLESLGGRNIEVVEA